jgi:hypothetical protein
VRGDRVSFNEIAKQLEEVYRTKIVFQNSGTIDDLKNIIDGMRKKEPDNAEAWISLLYLYYVLSGKGDLKNVDNTRYPKVKPLTVAGYLKHHTLANVTQGY